MTRYIAFESNATILRNHREIGLISFDRVYYWNAGNENRCDSFRRIICDQNWFWFTKNIIDIIYMVKKN